MTLKSGVLIASLAVALGAAGARPAVAGQITITAVNAFPNERMWHDPPQHAIDGNTGTFTWTTPAYNTAPSYLAIGFARTSVNRIRLWKTPEGGGGENFKNLVIDYTTDPAGPLSARSWTRVSGLRNGFNGQEPMTADSVNADGSVTRDRHDSVVSNAWASLTFNAVEATGLRIGFSSPGLVHYRVGELQAHFDPAAFMPPPANLPVSLQEAQAFPNGRTTNDLPRSAIDGNAGSFTWSTDAYNTASPSYLAVGFARTGVNRLRLWKTPEGGGGENFKNLVIEYTADAAGPLSSRSWRRVSGLRNGHNGQEPMTADSVNADGSVTRDRHDSVVNNAWASLTFDPVEATGLRIGFSSPGLVHYRVGEIQVYPAAAAADPGGEPAGFERPSVNGAVLTAAWIPETTARKFCEIEQRSRLISFRISAAAIPPGTTVTRANLYSADDWGRTFNGMLVPNEDRYYDSIVCSGSTARLVDLNIDTQPRRLHENPGVYLEVLPFTARLEYSEEYVRDARDSGVVYRPYLALHDLKLLRPGIPVIFYEEPAIPQLGFKHAQFAAAIAPQVEELRNLLTIAKRGRETGAARWNAKHEIFPVRCSFQGFANRNDVNIVLPLVCNRDDAGVAWDRRAVTLYAPAWQELIPEETYRIATVPALADYLANPYRDALVTIDYRIDATLRTDGVIPRSSIDFQVEGGDPYVPEIKWRDGFGIEAIYQKGTGTGMAGIDTSSGTLTATGYTAQGALHQSDVAAAFKQINDVMTVISVAEKAGTFFDKGGFANFQGGLQAAAQTALLSDPAAGWSLANLNPVVFVIAAATQIIQHNLNVAAKNAFKEKRDRIEKEVGDFADKMARDIAMRKYYGEIYPYRRELFTLQFLVAAAGAKLGDRTGNPYPCDAMMCQSFTGGGKLAVLPPVNRTRDLRNLWRIQEGGVWRDLCYNNCPVQ